MPHWFSRLALQRAVMNKSLSYKTHETTKPHTAVRRRDEEKKKERDKETEAETHMSGLQEKATKKSLRHF